MFKPLHFSYKWDKKQFLEASRESYRYEMKHSPKRFLGWIFIAFTQFGVISAFRGAPIGMLLVSSFLVIYWYFLRWPLREMMLSKRFEKDEYYSVLVEDSYISINQKEISWDDILEVVSLTKGFLIFAKEKFIFFPKDAFADMDERNEFAYIAKKRVANYKKDD